MSLTIKPKSECAFDQISLGEVMLRLDPGEGRIRTARQFQVWEGGGEYNVSRGLRKCFGYKTAVVTAFADNEVGHLVEDFIMQGGVDTDFIQWRDDDGIGRTVRNGLNFTERGFGIRGAVGNPDRGNTAASQLKPGDIDWDHIFGKLGVALVPHRRHLRRPLRNHRRAHHRGRARPPTNTAPSFPTTSTTARRSGKPSAASTRPRRSTARSPNTSM